MSLRYLGTRLSKNVWFLVQRLIAKGGRVNVFEGAPVGAAAGTTASGGVVRRARRVLYGNASGFAADLRNRLTRRFFYGDTTPTFALIGLSLAGGSLANKESEAEELCYNIRDIISKYPWKFDFDNPNHLFYNERVSLKDLKIHEFISKGSCGVVYSAKIDEGTEAAGVHCEETATVTKGDPTTSGTKYPLALKMMFNYDIQSSSMAILNAMYRETIPAQRCQAEEQISYWNKIFQKEKVRLPPHPNIVAIYDVFADFMPNIDGSMDIYPDALPRSLNPNGSGRNMTLFLLMKRYQCSLREYLNTTDVPLRDSVLLFAQLLEGIVHINRYGIAHRDLKTDNLLIDEVQVGEDCFVPLLAITDFGCCLADADHGLQLPYRTENMDKGGNMSLMAPEIILQRPGVFNKLDYSKSDLWAAGAIAYEIFGTGNPFISQTDGYFISNVDYKESQLPQLTKDVPPVLQRLIKNLLSRNPTDRLSPEIAANVCELYLWGPSAWMYSKKAPTTKEILEWLLCLTTKIICEGRLFNRYSDGQLKQNTTSNPDYVLIASFLSRVRLSHVRQALDWIQKR